MRACPSAWAKALAISAALTGLESWAVMLRKLPSLSAGLVGATEMWPASPRPAAGGRPSSRAARRVTGAVLISVCASAIEALELTWLNDRGEAPAVACTSIVALDW